MFRETTPVPAGPAVGVRPEIVLAAVTIDPIAIFPAGFAGKDTSRLVVTTGCGTCDLGISRPLTNMSAGTAVIYIGWRIDAGVPAECPISGAGRNALSTLTGFPRLATLVTATAMVDIGI
jgi:hypothetical protein